MLPICRLKPLPILGAATELQGGSAELSRIQARELIALGNFKRPYNRDSELASGVELPPKPRLAGMFLVSRATQTNQNLIYLKEAL